jgi:hypothetical protein
MLWRLQEVSLIWLIEDLNLLCLQEKNVRALECFDWVLRLLGIVKDWLVWVIPKQHLKIEP